MNKFYICLALCLASFSSWAQETLSGKVLDAQTNDPLIGATIWTAKSGRGTVTDQNGEFILSKLPAETIILKVSFLGYELLEQEFNLPYSGELIFRLNSKDILTEEFIVSATRASESYADDFFHHYQRRNRKAKSRSGYSHSTRISPLR